MHIFGRFSSRDSKAAKRLAKEIELLHKSPLLDPIWYRQISLDLRQTPVDVARHYLEHGAAEGRDPSPLFDTNFYLKQNPDVAASGMNPLVHYILHGENEGREPRPRIDSDRHPVEFEQRAERPLDPGVRSRQQNLRTGSVDAALDSATAPDVISNRQRGDHATGLPKDEVAEQFDEEFYLETYPDVTEAKVDPLEHFFYVGWKEGRDPAPWFSTAYYLKTNVDVAAAGVNPFWHYVKFGAEEGRIARCENNARREFIERLAVPEEDRPNVIIGEHDRLDERRLKDRFRSAIEHAAGIVCSVSHTCYPRTTAGTELFIADEEERFKAERFAYIHISPLIPSNLVSDAAIDDAECWVVIDGEPIGVATYALIARSFAAQRRRAPPVRIFVVHSPQGHAIQGLLSVWRSFDPSAAYYWLHNYSSLCYGGNLLRNKVEFCHAPPLGSVACDICVFGSLRSNHLQNLARLFEVADFIVVAPSRAARDIWLEASDLPRRSVIVVEHCQILEAKETQRSPVGKIDANRHVVRVGFVGYPVMHKGWSIFERAVRATRGDDAYEFFHFAAEDVLIRSGRIRGVPATVSREHRDEMVRLLTEHEIDIVVVPALWPETFSYVTFEALAAGCDILTLADSGNVAATVSATGRGRVFANEEELVGFFTSHQVVDLARIRLRQPNPRGSLVHCGTTAAILFGPAARQS